MIIYALIIIAILFFLSWNLINNRKWHLITSMITTVLFVGAVGFAVANFSYHYGMRQVSEPATSRQIYSLSPLKSLKLIAYRPMGSDYGSQLIIYKNQHHRVIHTKPDINVHNKIVRRMNVKRAHVVTKASKWVYRTSWDRAWFNLAKKPSVYSVNHVFYVPGTWKKLTDKQTLAFRQIIKNRSTQLKKQMQSPKVKLQIKQQASAYVKAKVMTATRKNPRLPVSQKKRIMRQAIKSYKSRIQQRAEDKVVEEALDTSKTIH